MKCGPFHTRFSTCVKALHLRLFVQFQKMSEVGICGDALQLVGHDPSDILLDPVVVFLYHFLHVIHPFIVHEAGDNGYLLICLFLFGYFWASTTISQWKIFCSILSPKLSATEPTNIPCVSPLILLGGMRLSIWVDMEVETSCRLMEMEWRF